MKITSVDTMVLQTDRPVTTGYAQRWGSKATAVVVKVSTDEGLTGWGQVGAPVQASAKAVLDQEIAPLLIGQDPFRIEELWQRAIGSFSPFGVQGLMFQALSGVDIALWDIKAKALNLPLWRLFGAKFRDRVLAYASGPYYFRDEKIPERVSEEALRYKNAGYKACKIKIGGMHPKDDLKRVEGVRRAVGDDMAIMVDANQAYNAHTAVRLGLELEKLDITWFEEPVPCTDLEGYIRVRSVLKIPIAGGEVEWSRFGFRDLISRGCVDIVQPDLGNSGGFTECRRIATLADAWGVQYVPHVVSTTPIAVAAALHLMAVLRPFPDTRTPSPFNQEPTLEFHQHSSPLRDDLADVRFNAVDGYMDIPDGPGLGIEIDEKAVQRFQI